MIDINWIVTSHDCIAMNDAGQAVGFARPLEVLSDHKVKRTLRTNPRTPQEEQIERDIKEYRLRKGLGPSRK